MVTARSFLLRGLLAGLIAGIVCFGVAFTVGEPSVRTSIGIEESGPQESSGHTHSDEPAAAGAPEAGAHEEGGTVVPRSLQSTLGLLTATAVAGVTLGGLVGAVSALALGRFGRLRVRATTLLVTGVGFTCVYVLPSLVYPPNPPAVGQSETIGLRTALYFTMVAISVIAGVTAVGVGRHLARRWGAWYAGLAALAGFGLVMAVAAALLPSYNEVPADFPATVLYSFRRASFLTELALWGVLGVTLAELAHRLTARSARVQPRPLADVRS
ncbi:CbtA family protein [uncultured Friedmanniella sp.]|uniref:CbtA family protein n=1 Tax=uncultured Friedmanniella sp. TaxID=335381 RepID=UPI0035CA78D0